MRIAIIGAGIAGLTTAWLLGETEDVMVYERSPRIGGHADSVAVDLDGRTVHVDLGAQHLAPGAFPAHTALRAILDVTADDVLEAPLHTTVMSAAAPQQLLVTPHTPFDSPGSPAQRPRPPTPPPSSRASPAGWATWPRHLPAYSSIPCAPASTCDDST